MSKLMSWPTPATRPTRTRRRKKGWVEPGVFDPWEYNTIPIQDREWMKKQANSADSATLRQSLGISLSTPGDE